MAERIYVGTIGEGLFRSLDGGQSFTRAAEGMFVECHVRALVAHPHDDRVLLLGSEQGLFRSTDAASNWAAVAGPLQGRQIWSILLWPSDPDVILVGTCPAAIYRSDDAGRNWREVAADIRQDCPRIRWTRVTSFLVEPAEPDVIWAGVEIDGLFRSTDAGRSFTRQAGSGLSSLDIHSLARVPANGQPATLLAATNNDLNLSHDDGRCWEPLSVKDSLPWGYCRALAQPVGQPEVVLLGLGNGPPGSAGIVARSDDGGLSWRAANMPGLANSTIWNFAVHPAQPELILASSVSGQLYRSRDMGLSWEKLNREFGEIRALAWTP